MSDLIKCKALVAFTRYVTAHGMIHGDPDNKEAKYVNVPPRALDNLLADELVERPKGYKTAAEVEAEERQAALDAAVQAELEARAAAGGEGAPPA